MKWLFLLFFTCSSPAFCWWCEGHEAVALIAERHLSPAALQSVNRLLKENPSDVPRSCKSTVDDTMAVASTWADDVKSTELTAMWHYMDIPLGLKKGDPERYCEPVGPSHNGGQRPGCILSALRSAVNLLHSDKEPDNEKAVALRYLIHLVGDLHQPLHTTSNNDRGGNCAPVQFFDDPQAEELHAVWDGLILNRDLQTEGQTVSQYALALDSRYAKSRAGWIKNAPEFDKWAWEGHMIAQKIVYGDLVPEPPVEQYDPHADCAAETARVAALHIKIAGEYQASAAPVIDEQIAKAGYRLAAILNLLFGE